MNRYICIHGHFYQPPRENPWLEDIEVQDSAYPYHNWNARIAAECYAPNTAVQIRDSSNRIINIESNYEKMSFNFGPTLCSWMQLHAKEEYAAILEADKRTVERYSGHGSAIAQMYNHMIAPLANSRDKLTQVIWGIADFKFRFGRQPEGMWLPETAVDLATLEILAEWNIKYTILAPHQAAELRKVGEQSWQDVSGGRIDPKRAYKCALPSGKTIALFFYDGPISGGISSGTLLRRSEDLAGSLVNAFTDDEAPQLVHIAVDGETFGHHHRYSEMAIGYALHSIESHNLARVTNYGQFLEENPPEYEVRIVENSSWSCIHGIERWRSDCGCNSGGHPEWTQQWRATLREAMDFVRESLWPVYEKQMIEFTDEPDRARNEYIDVILDRGDSAIRKFFDNFERQFSEEEKTRVLKMLEMQRHCMLMYTSCGWFFDELSGIEGVQVMQYAARAMQMAKEAAGIDIENDFRATLKKATLNIDRSKTGDWAYKMYVKPAAIDLHRVAAHYAIASLFDEYPASCQIYCYWVTSEMFQRWQAGTLAMIVGRAELESNITREKYFMDFAVLRLFENNIYGGIVARLCDESFETMSKEIEQAFGQTDIAGVVRIMNTYFGKHNYSLSYLFKDEQRKILNQIFTSGMKEVEFAFRYVYGRYYSLMQAMREAKMPWPRALLAAGEFILNGDIVEELKKETTDYNRLASLASELKTQDFEIDKTTVSYMISQKIIALMKQLYDNPEDTAILSELNSLLGAISGLPTDNELWRAQNICFQVYRNVYDRISKQAELGDEKAQNWITAFNLLSNYFAVKLS